MYCHYLLLCLSGTLVWFVADTAAIEAVLRGELASPLQFPYQVSIHIANHGHGCGGAIIDSENILTAASCILAINGKLGGRPISVLFGTTDLRTTNPQTGITPVKTVFIPTDYTPGSHSTSGDIAVLTLERRLILIRPSYLESIRLPKNQRDSYDGRTAIIGGFGWQWINVRGQEVNGGRNDTRLRWLNAIVLSQEECKQDHPSVAISAKHLCAKAKQRDSSKPRGVCIGDGGSPLVYDGTLIGIFSFGPRGCNETTMSAVYTRVQYYLTLVRHSRANKDTKYMRKIVV